MQDRHTADSDQSAIEKAIVSGILSARILPGMRLGETQLAEVYGVSRTKIREALMRLVGRGVVKVSPRRGWFVVEPSAEEAVKVYEARRIIECGLLRGMTRLSADGRQILLDHLNEEKQAIAAADKQLLTCLMGDFHIRIAEIAGNEIIVDLLRDLTARTILISMLYQSDFHAVQSHEGHCRMFEAMDAGDFSKAADFAATHLDEVEAGLDLTRRRDRHSDLRKSLSLPPFHATT